MSAFGAVVNGRGRGVRCDGSGRISRDPDGYYFDRASGRGGTISSRGRNCQHDFCANCDEGDDACPKCAPLNEAIA